MTGRAYCQMAPDNSCLNEAHPSSGANDSSDLISSKSFVSRSDNALTLKVLLFFFAIIFANCQTTAIVLSIVCKIFFLFLFVAAVRPCRGESSTIVFLVMLTGEIRVLRLTLDWLTIFIISNFQVKLNKITTMNSSIDKDLRTGERISILKKMHVSRSVGALAKQDFLVYASNTFP